MNGNIVACCLLVLAYLAGVAAAGLWLIPFDYKSRIKSLRKYLSIVFLAVSVMLLESAFIVGQCQGNFAQRWTAAWSWTFQFFSLDAPYTEIIQKAACAFPDMQWVNSFYALSCLYVIIVPISGGAFLLNLLTSLIPHFKLMISPKKTKFVFSELNERSITLAENIARLSWQLKFFRRRKHPFENENIDFRERKWLKSACIVFTDAYTDKESEISSELLARAKRIGAICLKDDILERPFHWSNPCKKIVYFLMDSKEENNFTAALSLLGEKKNLWKGAAKREKNRGMDMYVFTQEQESVRLIDEARKKLVIPAPVLVKCVNEYRNVVYKMFDDRELLNGLIAEKIEKISEDRHEDQDLYKVWTRYFMDNMQPNAAHKIRIVIFGSGRLAKEYFKTAVWCCKMSSALDKKELEKIEILVFSKNATALKNELRMETKLCMDPPMSAGGGDFSAKFIEEEFPSQRFINEFKGNLLQPNSPPVQRFLIAFGDDRLNYEAARWLRGQLGERFGAWTKDVPPTIIDFAIEDNEFFKVLNGAYSKTEAKQAEKEQININKWCLMRPFSTMQECFSYSNIRFDDLEQRAALADRVHSGESRLYDEAKTRAFLNNYERESSVAIAMHTLYKGFCRTSDGGRLNLYEMMLSADEEQRRGFENQVCWLEHCRWLAYMRVCGYRCPTAKEFVAMVYKNGYAIDGTHKNKDLCLHACMLKSEGCYYSLKDLQKKFEQYYPSIEDGVKALRSEISHMQKSGDNGEDLDQWLSRIILPQDRDVDALDRLSLLVFLTMEDGARGKFKGYKVYDVDISKELYRQILQLKSVKYYEDYQKAPNGEKGNANGALLMSLKRLLGTWPEDYKGEIEVLNTIKYRLLLVPNDSHWRDLKNKLAKQLNWDGFDWTLIAISGECYDEHNNDQKGVK